MPAFHYDREPIPEILSVAGDDRPPGTREFVRRGRLGEGAVRALRESVLCQYITVTSVIALVTLANILIEPWVGVHATALVFLLVVVVLALFVERGPTLLAATISALLWDFYFLPPVFAFRVYHVEDAMILGMYFVVAIILGQLTTRIQRQEEAVREREVKARVLAESERLGKTLLDSMSHEIRTPLAVITGAAGHLNEVQEGALPAPQQAMIAEIQEAADRLNRLVGHVLDIARLESGHVKPKLTLCDVRDLVQVAVREKKQELSSHRLSVQLAPNLPLVRMDYVLVQQALVNLLSNAAFHTPKGTAIQASARVDEDALILAVADEGPGLAEASLPHLFEKFYRAPTAPTGGTGLGLSLVKGFIESQDGQVFARNRPEGGAEFEIRLPLHPAGPASEPLPP